MTRPSFLPGAARLACWSYVHAYHTDERGFYRRKPWGRPRLRGWARTNADGKYKFHTIRLPEGW